MERIQEREQRRNLSAHRGFPRLTVGLTAVLLAGCAGSPVSDSDELVQAAWSTRAPALARPAGEAPAAEEHAEPAGPWTLERILSRIREANPTLGVARQRIAEARAVQQEAKASYLPEFSVGLQYVSTDNPGQAFGLLLNQEKLNLGPGFDPTPPRTENFRKELRFDWPLFAPGRSESKDAAGEAVEAATLARGAIERRLLNAGVQATLGLRAARDLEKVAEQTVHTVEQRLEETRKRYREGAALHADVLRLEVRLAAARQGVAQATLAVHRAESGLNRLMGRAPSASIELADETIEVGGSLPDGLDALTELARERRLDLAAKAHEVRMAGFQRRAASSHRGPILGAFGAYDIDGPEPGIDTSLDSATLGLALVLPISARTGARIQGARAAERRARAELEELALSIGSEVREASDEVSAALRTRELAETAVGAAEEAYRIVAAAQDAGGATVTDVLEAENALDQARVRLVAARAGVQIARAKLVAATGGVR